MTSWALLFEHEAEPQMVVCRRLCEKQRGGHPQLGSAAGGERLLEADLFEATSDPSDTPRFAGPWLWQTAGPGGVWERRQRRGRRTLRPKVQGKGACILTAWLRSRSRARAPAGDLSMGRVLLVSPCPRHASLSPQAGGSHSRTRAVGTRRSAIVSCPRGCIGRPRARNMKNRIICKSTFLGHYLGDALPLSDALVLTVLRLVKGKVWSHEAVSWS